MARSFCDVVWVLGLRESCSLTSSPFLLASRYLIPTAPLHLKSWEENDELQPLTVWICGMVNEALGFALAIVLRLWIIGL